MHFTNQVINNALVCEAYELDGAWVVNVPNILLQDNLDITAYAFGDNHTKYEKVIEVKSKSKPDDYVYTETEVFDFNNKLSKNIDDYFSSHSNSASNYFMMYDVNKGSFVVAPAGYLAGTDLFTSFADYGNYYDDDSVASAFYQIGAEMQSTLKMQDDTIIFTSKDDFVNYPFKKNVIYKVDFPNATAIQSDFAGGEYYCITDKDGYLYLYGINNNIKYFYKGAVYGFQLIQGYTPFKNQSEFFSGNSVDNALNQIGDSLIGVEELLASI